MKIRVVGAEFFCLDGRTRRQIESNDEGNSRFRNFANAARITAYHVKSR